jgi:hypothetical protein
MMQSLNVRWESTTVKLAHLNLLRTQAGCFSFLHRHNDAAVIDPQGTPRSINFWTRWLSVHVLMQKTPIEHLVVPTWPHVFDYRRFFSIRKTYQQMTRTAYSNAGHDAYKKHQCQTQS